MASPLPPMRLLLSLTQKRLCLKYWGRNRNTDSIQPIFFAANILPNLSMSYNTNHYSFTVSIFLLYYCCLTLHGLFLMVEVGHYRLCGNILHLPVFLHLVTKLYDAERVSQNNEESEEKTVFCSLSRSSVLVTSYLDNSYDQSCGTPLVVVL